jgi:hypothetical protein
MKRLLPLPFLFALLIAPLRFGESEPAYACYCVTPEVTERVEEADLIFVGSITGVQGAGASASFEVERYLKGSGGAEVFVSDSSPGSDCAFGFIGVHLEEKLVMFAYTRGSHFETHICSGNVRLPYEERQYDEVLAVTGPGVPPEGVAPQDEAGDHEKDTPWAVVLPIAFAIPLATLLVPAFLRKRTAGH